jgi:murein DD-endopeptidase MepM/ murein hydrolase activator NlpD
VARRLLSLLLTLLVLGTLAWLAWPAVRQAVRFAQLVAQPAPVARSLPNPLPARAFVDTWGGARAGGRRHEGVDIFAPLGTPIRATTRGVVTRIGVDRLGGNVVTVTGPGGYHHYYAHLSRFAALSNGDWVERGDVVGYVGVSGNARGTPPHLHYGVYTPTWRAVNPYPLLRQD